VLATTTARYLAAHDYPIGLPEQSIDELVELLRAVWGTEDGSRALVPSLDGDSDALEINARLQRGAMTPRRAAAYYEQVLRTADVRSVLGAIHVPTLVVHPTDFALLPIEHGRSLAQHIEGARLVEVPSRDSWFVLDAADVVIHELAEFVTGERLFDDVDRALVTILFTDIVGSTETAARLGDLRWRRLLDLHDDVVRDHLRRHRGREVNTTGDGFVAAFDGPGRAIQCAAAVIEATAAVGIDLRAGLHTGECEVRGDDLSGMAVHIAARVGAQAGSGEVLVSGTVKDLVVGSKLRFHDRGEHELKGVPGRWPLFRAEA
jgi:class 3 adenylate cyclase